MPADLIVHAMLLVAVVALLGAVVLALPLIFYDLRRDLDYFVAQDAKPSVPLRLYDQEREQERVV